MDKYAFPESFLLALSSSKTLAYVDNVVLISQYASLYVHTYACVTVSTCLIWLVVWSGLRSMCMIMLLWRMTMQFASSR